MRSKMKHKIFQYEYFKHIVIVDKIKIEIYTILYTKGIKKPFLNC